MTCATMTAQEAEMVGMRGTTKLRVARPTDNLSEVTRFYKEGLPNPLQDRILGKWLGDEVYTQLQALIHRDCVAHISRHEKNPHVR
jgi:hypothetical protein